MSLQELDQDDLCVFIDAISEYFRQITSEDASVRPSYLLDSEEQVGQEYTGRINITGQYRGSVYFAAPSALLRHLLLAQGERWHSEENMLDLVGEVANTLAGNARRYFGERFMISVPQTLRGTPDRADPFASPRPFVIPLNWKQYNALLVVDVTTHSG